MLKKKNFKLFLLISFLTVTSFCLNANAMETKNNTIKNVESKKEKKHMKERFKEDNTFIEEEKIKTTVNYDEKENNSPKNNSDSDNKSEKNNKNEDKYKNKNNKDNTIKNVISKAGDYKNLKKYKMSTEEAKPKYKINYKDEKENNKIKEKQKAKDIFLKNKKIYGFCIYEAYLNVYETIRMKDKWNNSNISKYIGNFDFIKRNNLVPLERPIEDLKESEKKLNDSIKYIKLGANNFKNLFKKVEKYLESCENIYKKVLEYHYIGDLKNSNIDYSNNKEILEYAKSEILKMRYVAEMAEKQIENKIVENLREQDELFEKYFETFKKTDEEKKEYSDYFNKIIEMMKSENVSFKDKVIEKFKFLEKLIKLIVEDCKKIAIVQ